jgi:hypothetical protein
LMVTRRRFATTVDPGATRRRPWPPVGSCGGACCV